MSAQNDRAVRAQAQSMMQSGHVEAAQSLLEQHLTNRARDHEAMAILAQIFAMQRRLDEAESLAMRAIRGDRKRADYHALLGEILMTAGRHRDALARFEQATKLHQDYDAAMAGMGEAFLRMGQPNRTLEYLGRAVDTPITSVPMARALIRTGDPQGAISRIRPHLPASQSPLDVQRGLWFALANACEKTGDFDGAYEAASKGNAISSSGWNVEQDAERHQILMDMFSSEAMPMLPKSEVRGEKCVFIVGLLRSGSTLTEQILDAHPQATGIGESECLPRLIEEWQSRAGTTLPWPALLGEVNESTMTEIAKAYLDEVERQAPDADLIIDKQLGNYLNLGAISLLFPEAKIIHCTRDPMDLGLSCWMQKLPPGTNPWASDLESIGQCWRHMHSLMSHWNQTLNIPILEVKYETLVADLNQEVPRILEFCGLPENPACLEFWKTGRTVLTLSSDQVRQPIYHSAVGRHQAWGHRLDPLRAAIAEA